MRHPLTPRPALPPRPPLILLPAMNQVVFSSDAPVVFLAAGAHHSMSVAEDGAVHTWGNGASGQLGHGDKLPRLTPTLVSRGAFGGEGRRRDAGQVLMGACGAFHSLAITRAGQLFSWGAGADSQLGHGDCECCVVPTLVDPRHFARASDKRGACVCSVAAGYMHSVCVTLDGRMYSWGAGNADEAGTTEPTGLGLGDLETRRVPAALPPTVFSCGGGNRIGRCRRLPPASALAFAMATHARLGADSAAHLLVVEVGLLRLIVW